MSGPPFMSLLAGGLFAGELLAAGGLTVTTTSPDALCPPLEETRQAVASRLGSVELEGPWEARYEVVHRVTGDYVELVLRGPDGSTELERSLPIAHDSCATLAQVIALVLERYFERPAGMGVDATAPAPEGDATPGGDEGAPSATEAPAPGASPAPPPPGDATPTPSPPPPDPPRAPVAMGLELELRATSAWLAPGARGVLVFGDQWLVALGAGLDLLDHERRVASGWARLRRVPTSLFLAFQRSGSTWSYALGPELLIVHERASTVALVSTGAASRLVPAIGVRAEVRLSRAGARWQPFLAAEGAWGAGRWAAPFRVDEREIFAFPATVGGLDLGFGGWR